MRQTLKPTVLAGFGMGPIEGPVERIDGPGPAIELIRIAPAGAVKSAFLIGRFEVTNAQFETFVRATGYDGSKDPSSKPTEPFLADWKDGRPPEFGFRTLVAMP